MNTRELAKNKTKQNKVRCQDEVDLERFHKQRLHAKSLLHRVGFKKDMSNPLDTIYPIKEI